MEKGPEQEILITKFHHENKMMVERKGKKEIERGKEEG